MTELLRARSLKIFDHSKLSPDHPLDVDGRVMTVSDLKKALNAEALLGLRDEDRLSMEGWK